MALNGYRHLHLIWNFSCAISERFVLLRDNSSQIIFRLIPNIMSRQPSPNQNQVNTNTSWNKISIQMNLNLTVFFVCGSWWSVTEADWMSITKMADLSSHLSQVHKRVRKRLIILHACAACDQMILLAGCGVSVCVWRWNYWKKTQKKKEKAKQPLRWSQRCPSNRAVFAMPDNNSESMFLMQLVT